MRLAAIDIGSNAARLLISDAFMNEQGRPQFQKLNLVRVPLRLGFDVFEDNNISPEKETMIIKTIRSYKLLTDVYGVEYMKACATSAMPSSCARSGLGIAVGLPSTRTMPPST